MTEKYVVKYTELSELDQIFALFDHSVRYQQSHGYPDWKNYDRNAIIRDIENRNQYKVFIDSKIAMVFSIGYSDAVIWRTLEQGDAVYLHRVVVNPDFKGRKLFARVVDWSLDHVREKGLRYLRMDTWAANHTIIDYYKRFGFRVVETYTTPDSTDLPVHNRNLGLALLEYNAEGTG